MWNGDVEGDIFLFHRWFDAISTCLMHSNEYIFIPTPTQWAMDIGYSTIAKYTRKYPKTMETIQKMG